MITNELDDLITNIVAVKRKNTELVQKRESRFDTCFVVPT